MNKRLFLTLLMVVISILVPSFCHAQEYKEYYLPGDSVPQFMEKHGEPKYEGKFVRFTKYYVYPIDEVNQKYLVAIRYPNNEGIVGIPLTVDFDKIKRLGLRYTGTGSTPASQCVYDAINSIDDPQKLYFMGANMLSNEETKSTGVDFLMKAYKLGCLEAAMYLGFYEPTSRDAYKIFKELEQKENAQGTYGLALCYYKNSYEEWPLDSIKDLGSTGMKKKAFELLDLAIQRGYEEGKAIKLDWQKQQRQEKIKAQRDARRAAAEEAKFLRTHKKAKVRVVCRRCGGSGLEMQYLHCPHCHGKGYEYIWDWVEK